MITHWSIEEIALAKKLLGQGLSALQISAHLKGRTRNSVIGMFHRQNISMAKKPAAKVKVEKKVERKPVAKTKHVPKKPSRPKLSRLGFLAPHSDDTPKPTYQPLVEDNFERMWEPVNFRKVARGQCLWIIGEVHGLETMYCGEPIADIPKNRSWCKHHYLRVFPKGEAKNGKAQ